MSAIGQRLAQTYASTPPGFAGFDVNVVPMLTQFTGSPATKAVSLVGK
jgi:hypothetical protein